MSIQIKQSGNYPILKNESIFLEGQMARSLTLLRKGKVDVYLCPNAEFGNLSEETLLKNSYRIFTIDQSIFIGTSGLFLEGKHCYSFHAAEDSSLFIFPVNGMDQLTELLHTQKDYTSYIITSMSTIMNHSYTAQKKLENRAKALGILADNLSILFWALKERCNLSYIPNSQFLSKAGEKYQQLKASGIIPLQFTPEYLDQEIPELMNSDYTSLDVKIKDKLEYYKNILSLPLDLRNLFFSSNDYIANYHFKEVSHIIDAIKSDMKKSMRLGEKTFKRIYLKGESCIFTEFICLINEAKKYDQNSDELFQLLDHLVKRITDIAITFQDEYHYDLQLDIEQMIAVHQQLKGLSLPEPYIADDNNISNEETFPEELIDSAEKIIRYSGISNEKADLLRSNLNDFILIKTNSNTEIDSKAICRYITPLFFELYELVFKKVVSENNPSRLFEMFLTFGYMDERLLSPEHVMTLYKLLDKSPSDGLCTVYTLQEWLTQIYERKKDPSINEFGQDYFDIFREMKKKGQISDKEKVNYDNNSDGRLNFEIENMFKINQKVSFGQANAYFPILHNDMVLKDLSQALVTKDAINEVIRNILTIDFTAFHREIFYKNPKKGIEKELISKAVFPDIILMPTFGSRGSMWQEITGRVRSNPGRFILPVFTSENLEELLIKIIGNFRWELCRTMMGVSWNDISEKSLTSEYTDYIQFYKRNKALSEEGKEKLKIQIARYNNLRDTFTSDYKTWIKNECNGNVRLNKVARSILYKYCPFEKSIREKLERQPIFNELAIPFNIVRSKQARELESRYNKLLGNNNISSDVDLEANLNFYKEQ